MRIALISVQATADDAPDMLLGSLTLAGRSLAERQLDLALLLGCRRVICLAAGLDRRLLALQHRAERAEAQFNLISGARGLHGLVSANDELITIADGLLPAPDDAARALGESSGVLVLPVEAGTAIGLERIDLNYAWAGVLAMPGRLVDRLAELPADCDPVAGLLRIALQGRVPLRMLPEAVLAEGRWAPIHSRQRLAELEPGWFHRHTASPDWRAPGQAIARAIVRRSGARLLERNFQARFATGAGILLAALGIIAAWLAVGAVGLVLLAAGAWLTELGGAFDYLTRAEATGTGQQRPLAVVAAGALDVVLVVILALSLPETVSDRLFAPLVLVGLLRAGARMIQANWVVLIEDRAMLAIALAIACAFGVQRPVMELIALALLAAILALSRGATRLTQA